MKKTIVPLTVGSVTVGGEKGCLVTADGREVRVRTDGAQVVATYEMTNDCSRASIASGVDVFRFRGGLAFFADEAALFVLSGECKIRAGGEEEPLAGGEAVTGLSGKICLEAGVATTVVRIVTEEL